jgi:hypothetical protein
LEVVSVTYLPETPIPNQPLQMTATIKNNGPAAAIDVEVIACLNNGVCINVTDAAESLAAGSSLPVLLATNLAEGTYVVTVEVTSATPDLDFNNNVMIITIVVGGGAETGARGTGTPYVPPVPPTAPTTILNLDSAVTSTQSMTQGSSISMVVGGATHTGTVVAMTDNSVTMQFESEPQTVTIFVGQTEEVDLDRDGINDISVMLNKIVNGEADITFTKLVVAPEEREPEITPEEGLTIYLIIALILIIIVGGYLYFKGKRKPKTEPLVLESSEESEETSMA